MFIFVFFADKYRTNLTKLKSIDRVHGIRTRGGRMVGTDESTELGMTARLTLKFANGIDNENRKMEKFRKSPSRKCFTVLA